MATNYPTHEQLYIVSKQAGEQLSVNLLREIRERNYTGKMHYMTARQQADIMLSMV